VRRQNGDGGPSAGSSRVQRLDPLSLPISFEARDARADGGTRHVEIARDHVVLRRSVRGMRMAINIRISDFLGVALDTIDGAPTLILKHRDPSLSVPLSSNQDESAIGSIWRSWSETFALPCLDGQWRWREPAPRRRRRNAIRSRRPSILMRRRCLRDFVAMDVYRGEREIIARN
jgi:Family of unknown function (DUF6101)